MAAMMNWVVCRKRRPILYWDLAHREPRQGGRHREDVVGPDLALLTPPLSRRSLRPDACFEPGGEYSIA